MNRFAFLKSLLPALIPLIVFIVADEIWGTKIGIIVALIVGIGEFLYVLLQEKRIDKFILIDTIFLVVMGGISILLDNAIFFKLKPALIQSIFCVIIGISVFSNKNIILLMSQRYMKGMQLNDAVLSRMKITFRNLFWIFTAHTLLIVYAAFYLSERSWAFISTALFYILFGVYYLIDFLYWRNQAKKR
jgi:intracellular septation protein A